MNAFASSLLLLTGVASDPATSAESYYASSEHRGEQAIDAQGTGDACSNCNGGTSRKRMMAGGRIAGRASARYGTGPDGWQEMPQTCYQPHYGCYPAGSRWLHRYTAFHGYYYRRPYNYRNLFDYPWHARLHEPTSLFSYHVPREHGRENEHLEEVELGDEVPPAPEEEDVLRSGEPAPLSTSQRSGRSQTPKQATRPSSRRRR